MKGLYWNNPTGGNDIGRVLNRLAGVVAGVLVMVATAAAPAEAQDRRWVLENVYPAGRVGSDALGAMASFSYQSNGLLPGEAILASLYRQKGTTGDGSDAQREVYLIALSAIEDLRTRFDGKKMWGFADWGLCGLSSGECVKYLPMSGYVGPMVRESVTFEGKPPRASATCFDTIEEAYQKQLEGGRVCGPSSMRVVVPSTTLTYDLFLSKLARFEAFDRGNVRLALRFNDGEENFRYLTMHLTGLPELLREAVSN